MKIKDLHKIEVDADVEEFISSLEKQTIAKTLRTIDLLQRFGFALGMPHSKKVVEHLFELRVRGRQEVRIFYCFFENRIYLLMGFIKKSQKIPQKELVKAMNKYRALVS